MGRKGKGGEGQGCDRRGGEKKGEEGNIREEGRGGQGKEGEFAYCPWRGRRPWLLECSKCLVSQGNLQKKSE
jgi:hypothetical protein